MTSVGRALAPHLKALMPTWYISRNDPHVPSASLARRAIKEAFPAGPKKAAEAVTFCTKDILATVKDNILVQTAQTLSDPR